MKRKPDPWQSRFWAIRSRCNDKNSNKYSAYGARGIKALISKEELKTIWMRDKAYEMRRPSIDRIDNDGDYSLENCRFIELSLNCSRRPRMNKLSPEKVLIIMDRVAQGDRQCDIAKDFNIHRTSVYKIMSSEMWNSVVPYTLPTKERKRKA